MHPGSVGAPRAQIRLCRCNEPITSEFSWDALNRTIFGFVHFPGRANWLTQKLRSWLTEPRTANQTVASLHMLSNKWRLVSFLQSWTQAQPRKHRHTVVVGWTEGVVSYPPSRGEYDKVSQCHSSTGCLGCQDSEDGRILEKSKAKKAWKRAGLRAVCSGHPGGKPDWHCLSLA